MMSVLLIAMLFFACKKAQVGNLTKPVNDNECVIKYQNCIAQVKANEEKAIKACNDAGGVGVADCIARVKSESEKLEKVCFEEFLKCKGE